MQVSSKRIHQRQMSFMTRAVEMKALKYSNTFRHNYLGKFSTSDPDEYIYNESQPRIEQQQQIVTQQSFGQNIIVPKVERPFIDSKLINSIFPYQKIQKVTSHQVFTNKFLLPSKFNQKDKVLNDYVVSKLKTIINKKHHEQQFILTKSKLQQYYSTFMETFSIADLKRVFQCLQMNRNISMCKQYILNQLYSYYSTRNRQKIGKRESFQNILQIKMKNNMIKKHESQILRARENISGLENCKKQIKRASSSESMCNRNIKMRKYEDLIDQKLGENNDQLTKETQIVNRLHKAQDILKKNMCKKVDLLLSSGQYYENGFGDLYNQFVQNGLDERVFSAFLGPKQMHFMKQKSGVQRQIVKLSSNGHINKSIQKGKIKNQISKLKNELIVMEEDIITRLRNDRHLEKNVYSLFGNGEKGKAIVERVRINSPIKS